MKKRLKYKSIVIIILTFLWFKPIFAQFKTAANDSLITISWMGTNPWKAVIDRKHGGVIRYFNFEDNVNIVENRNGIFSGLCNVFYSSRIDSGSQNREESTIAKGTLWRGLYNDTRIRLVLETEDKVVVNAKGTNSGWREIGPRGEKMVEFEQILTFRPDRIECEGNMDWVYPYDTKLKELTLLSYFSPGIFYYPVWLLNNGKEYPLAITGSHGGVLPEGQGWMEAYRVDLKDGYSLTFQMKSIPEIMKKSRLYLMERPWQREGVQVMGVGTDEEFIENQSYDDHVFYKYDIIFSRQDPAQRPPDIQIVSPGKGEFFKFGSVMKLFATATDTKGSRIPDENFEWEIWYGWNNMVQQSTGAVVEHVLPATGDVDPRKGYKRFWAVVTVKDNAERINRDYVEFKVN